MITALIPARGGSKGIPKKNIINLDGYPLIVYSIMVALKCPSIDRVIVSTDDKEIAEVSKRFGAEVPFMRPAEYATDDSSDLGVILHYVQWEAGRWVKVTNKDDYDNLEYIVHLRPTTPLRNVDVIEQAINVINTLKERDAFAVEWARKNISSLRSIHQLREPINKLFKRDKSGCLVGFFPDDEQSEYYNSPRQMFEPTWQPNGYVDIIIPDVVHETGTLHGTKMFGFETPNTGEVDTKEDLEFIEFMLQRHEFDSRELLRSYK